MFAKLLFLALLVSSLDALEHDLVVHSAPADDIVPESPEEDVDTNSPLVSAVQGDAFESAGEDGNSELTGDIEDSADEEDATTSLAQTSKKTRMKKRKCRISLVRRCT